MLELFVILPSEQAPDTAKWQCALDRQYIPVRFERAVDLQKARVLLPLKVDGVALELRFACDDYAQLELAYRRWLAQVRMRRPVVYTLGYGASLLESTAAFYLAAALVAEFGARAFEPQLGGFMSLQDLLDSAAGCLFLASPPGSSARVLQ